MAKEGYSKSIGFTQSVSSGIIAFHGTFEFDDPTQYDARKLMEMLSVTETIFKDEGKYKIATDIKPKEEKEKKKADEI